MNWLTGASKQNETKKLITSLSDAASRDSAARELIALGADSVPLLISALQTQGEAILPIQQILARMPFAASELIHQLQSAHPLVRGRVAEIFALSKDKSAIPALLDAAKGEYFTVRARAALALANMEDARVIPYLLPLLQDKECEVRAAACVAIAKFRDPSTFDDIANILLDDPKMEARQAAARALGDTRHLAALPYLMSALRDSFWWFEQEKSIDVLLAAIQSMGAAAFEPLLDALGDKEATVRKYAAVLLGKLGDVRAIEELGVAVYDLHNEVGKAAAEALTQFGAPAVEILAAALRCPEADIRENAARALVKIQDVRVAGLLVEALNDSDRSVQKQALMALGKLRDSRTWSALQRIAANRADKELSALARKILDAQK